MRVYSKTIHAFLQRLRQRTGYILSWEMGLTTDRKFVKWGYRWFSLDLVVFEDPKQLGYFSSEQFEIGLNKRLLYLSKPDIIDNILRHELAHFVTFLAHHRNDHGPEFQEACRRYQWGREVSSATADLDDENQKATPHKEFDKIFARIQKLLALAQSGNPHEAEAATLKANLLLRKHNLSFLKGPEEEEETFVKVVHRGKRLNAIFHALFDILRHFSVSPIFGRANGRSTLEVIGSRLNVELADYMAKFLAFELESSWENTKRKNGLSGIAQKNDYIQGVAKGLIFKLKKQKEQESQASKAALMAMEKSLEDQVRLIYPRLGTVHHRVADPDSKANRLGHEDGRNLSIRQGVTSPEAPLALTES